MSDDLKTLRADLQQWIDERLALLVARHAEENPPELPIVCDFSLAIAWEDAADEDSATHYTTISSYVPSYRILGLLQSVMERFRGPSLPYDEAGDD